MKASHSWTWIRWALLLALTATLAACGPAVTPTDAPPAPASAPTPTPAEPLATCSDSAIRLLDLGTGIHGAIVADTLHMGGVETPVTCAEPANLSLLADLSIPDDWTAQVQQSQYYLIVIRYPGGNRLYVISRRSDGTSCVVDTNDRCIAQVTELPDGFDLDDLPDDVAPTIPAGRPAPPTVSPPPGGGYTPPVVPAPPAASAPATAGNPQPRDGATDVAVETLLLSWSAAARAASYGVYWGREEHLAADADLGTPIGTTFTATTIRRPALGTTYYWRVDAKNDQGTTTGSVWSFTTADQAAPPSPGGGGYTPPVVSPPPAEPPPAEEPPPAGPPQPAVPAWPGGARSFEWAVGEWLFTPVAVAAPTGTPTPVVTHSILPAGMVIHLRDGYYHISPSTDRGRWLRRGEGVITLTATNSVGMAKTTVSYAISCRNSDAVIADWLKGSAWEPIRRGEPIRSDRWGGLLESHVEDTDSWLRRAVFNDDGNGLTVTTRTGGTERLTGGVLADSCVEIHNGTDWGFYWSVGIWEGVDHLCNGRGGTVGSYYLNRNRGTDSAKSIHNFRLRPAACDDNSPLGVP